MAFIDIDEIQSSNGDIVLTSVPAQKTRNLILTKAGLNIYNGNYGVNWNNVFNNEKPYTNELINSFVNDYLVSNGITSEVIIEDRINNKGVVNLSIKESGEIFQIQLGGNNGTI